MTKSTLRRKRHASRMIKSQKTETSSQKVKKKVTIGSSSTIVYAIEKNKPLRSTQCRSSRRVDQRQSLSKMKAKPGRTTTRDSKRKEKYMENSGFNQQTVVKIEEMIESGPSIDELA